MHATTLRIPGLVPAVLLLAPLLLASTGCALRKPVTAHAVAYNQAIADAHNRTVLLNVVRSMKRQPQQYTAISEVRGTASASLTPSLALTFVNGGGLSGGSSGLSGTASGGTSLVTVANLDDQEFTQAILNPISLDQFEFFMAQGWPERLLGLLFIRRMDIPNDTWKDPYGACKTEPARQNEKKKVGQKEVPVFIYKNEPQEWLEDPFLQMRCFGYRLMDLRERGNLRIAAGEPTQVGPEIAADEIEDLGTLVLSANAAGLRVQAADGTGGPTYKLFKSAAPKVVKYDQNGEEKVAGTQPAEPSRATFYLRSPLAVVYYLGEIARAQAVPGYAEGKTLATLDPRICEGRYLVKPPQDAMPGSEPCTRGTSLLFVARQKTGADKKPWVAVRHENRTWVIPTCPDDQSCHRSMQVLSIVNQLIGLNQKRETLPTTGVVTIAGG